MKAYFGAARLVPYFACCQLVLIGCASEGDPAAAAEGAAALQVGGSTDELPRFSFFVTSLRAMQELSRNQNGFGGDLRFGETGENAGLRGADKICATIAEDSMPGSGSKGWRAFLSATKGAPGGGPVHAIDRIGQGPWYDRLGRLVARTRADLQQVRPAGADPMIVNDLPNEDGVPNQSPDGRPVDNHHVLTGSGTSGQLYRDDPRSTCDDWTKGTGDTADAPRVGMSWPRGRPGAQPARGGQAAGRGRFGGMNGAHWISAMDESGCAPGVNLVQQGGPNPNNPTVGSGGGYGAIYCFALKP